MTSTNMAQRATMDEVIKELISTSTDNPVDGKIYIMYERLGDFQWLPGKGDGKFLRRFKHWCLVIQLGFDCITLEFFENSQISRQGVVMVGAFDPSRIDTRVRGGDLGPDDQQQPAMAFYHIGDLAGLSSEVLFRWIQEQFRSRTEYNVLQNNCQHFVYDFLAHFEKEYIVNRTSHFLTNAPATGVDSAEAGAGTGMQLGGQGERGTTAPSSWASWDPMLAKVGRIIGDLGFKSKSI
ncbi:hypothetical protein EC957_009781 [Mortierella hygrophila]|uniref:PPPDE domain-containing protein n=1 Tax=Mortierella hygrophila TaxID=979708 RepID=A0A9P6FBA7_9FUNG|nr:hypothetical protein EC957_009781 [Mortierella hygrophila]